MGERLGFGFGLGGLVDGDGCVRGRGHDGDYAGDDWEEREGDVGVGGAFLCVSWSRSS
jgi:hypothetical protein